MKVVLLLLVVLAACGCGRLAVTHKPAEPKADHQVAELAAEYTRRLGALEAATQDRGGWPSATDCDGTVWAGEACAAGAAVDLASAEYAPGEVHRRPKASGECYPAASASTVSRDQLALYAACAWRLKDRGALERLLAYAGAHAGFMGEPQDAGLTFLGPNLDTILARAVQKLGGAAAPLPLPVLEAPGAKDYQQHIEVNVVLLSTEIAGGATGWELNLLQVLVAGEPKDPLFQAALGVYTGDCEGAPRLLLDPATPVPSYVRGDAPDLFAQAWWLRAAAVVLSHCKGA